MANGNKLLLTLLATTLLFDQNAKAVIHRAVETDVLPELDKESLLYTLKMEKNAHAIIDQRAEKLLKKLKKKYNQE